MLLEDIAQVVVNGILLGGVYGLTASGLALVFGVLGLLNLAHGSFLVFAAFVYAGLIASTPWLPSAILTLALVTVGGWLLFLFVFGRALGPKALGSPAIAILVTLGIAFVVEELIAYLWRRAITAVPPSQSPPLLWAGLVLPRQRLVVLAVILATTAALQLWLSKSDGGRRIRGMAQDSVAATLMGISFKKAATQAFVLAAILAAIAGMAYAHLFPIAAHQGLHLTLKALFVVVISGTGSLVGPVAGGFILGLIETGVAACIGPQWSTTASLGIPLAIVCCRPAGLFAARGANTQL